MRTILLLLSVLLNVWLGLAVIRLENYHYAVQMGRCAEWNTATGSGVFASREACLNSQKMRTSPWWNLFWGLRDTIAK
ncbi:hypothetical protein AMC83_CH01919 [Rhizobium phaseoli]|uniref:hypothetical protein n=1 Tax=Rhizobium phaseoli TaxID=396 RepID=UPI0007EA1D16|nr:hypothetical protein [Rhizobium phaseoli]ANL71902.1 hypothetical protein AMC83_CH01919 [Rhizobium phaseoli]